MLISKYLREVEMSAKDNCKDVKYPITAQNISITCRGSLDFMGLRPLQGSGHLELGAQMEMDTGQWVSQTENIRDITTKSSLFTMRCVVLNFMSFLTLMV